MPRGGVVYLAASLFSGLTWPNASHAQAPIRTRDASFAVVRYDGGLTAGAFTLYDAVLVANDRTSRYGSGVLSIFNDGRFSAQGALGASRRSAPLPVAPAWHALFTAVRGEMLLDANTTIQTGFMPTAALTGRARLRFEKDAQGLTADAAIARAFDGRIWQTVVMGEARAWVRGGNTFSAIRNTTMQLGVGDLLSDTEGQVEWLAGGAVLAGSLGVRVGEAIRGNTAWGSFTATWPVLFDTWATLSVGTYPADLIQNLPAGRFVALSLRLPNGRLPAFRPPPPPPPPPRPRTPDLPVTFRLALVTGPALDSTYIREVKVWAPGAQTVELMADFVDWIPVPLIRQPNGEWRGYYRIAPGLHRLNLRLDGLELDAPLNWRVERDEFLGNVALVLVR